MFPSATAVPAQHLLVRAVEWCCRHAYGVMLLATMLAVFSCFWAATHLGLSSETDRLFSPDLPWRQRAAAIKGEFPQLQNLLVAVIDAREPEQAEITADGLTAALSADHVHFQSVRRPDGAAFFRQAGLLFLERTELETLLDRLVDAQPFLGELTKDPSVRGLFRAFELLARGVEQQDADYEGAYREALYAFHETIAQSTAGQAHPLSWERVLAGDVANDPAPYRFVLAQPTLYHDQLEFGGAAIDAMRHAINQLEFVQAGDARVRITGSVALANEEFATVARGAVEGMVATTVVIMLWLFLAVRSWPFIVAIFLTLALGLSLTLLFATIAVGTLNLVSVGFGILFVGIGVDFGIQFCVRYREMRRFCPNDATAMAETVRCAGGQVRVASVATAMGFFAFLPTAFRGVAELGLIAGSGMLIAFICTMTFLPALITTLGPPRDAAGVGLNWAAPLEKMLYRLRWPLLALFGVLALAGIMLLPRLAFDANPLHTKDPTTEAMRTLEDLRDSPLANPFTAEILAPDLVSAAALSQRLRELPSVLNVLSMNSFVPDDQSAKLTLVADARNLLRVTLALDPALTHPQPEEIRFASRTARHQLEQILPKLKPGSPIGLLADDLQVLEGASDDVLGEVDRALTRFLPMQVARLREALNAQPVTSESLPPALARDWVLPDGRARIQVVPKDGGSSRSLGEFVKEVTAVAPDAAGPAPTAVATGATIVASFRTAAIGALAAITAMLFLVLRRRLLDVALVLAPLLLSALMTVSVLVLLSFPLNYANIIVLPLLLGIGVAFNIYFVMNWRAGQNPILTSGTARAVLFSALTTGTAFGALALSRHPGTASMGCLLLVSLGSTLFASFTFLPALLAVLRSQSRWRPEMAGSCGINRDFPEDRPTARHHCSVASRRNLLGFALLTYVPWINHARGTETSAVILPIERFYAELLLIMRAGKATPFRQRYDNFAPIIERTFDLDAILESSVGPRWAALPSEQQSALREAFRRYTIAVYVSNFDSFSGQRFEIEPSPATVNGEEIVRTRIIPASGESHRLDYVMRQRGSTWKIVDVLADGSISRVAVQRSEMRASFASGGAPALVDRLRRKVSEMSGGQLQ